MEKIIHYCWFGGKPLPTMVKKCINSWKKFLPEYEIKEWNEKNFDVNCCPFVKEAYENKKWAFVSDYARIFALYNEGGIYFDTDMEIIKDPKKYLEHELIFGYENSGYFGTAIIGVKEKNNKYIKQILEFYNNLEHFYLQSISNYANPIIITNLVKEYDMKKLENGVEVYDNNIYVYPREYFYPLSYDYSEKVYTDKTCMIHFFSGTWTDKHERTTLWVYRKFGVKFGKRILRVTAALSKFRWRILHSISKFVNWAKLKVSIHVNQNKRVNKVSMILKSQDSYYVAIHHPEWIGVTNSTQDLFKYTVAIREQHTEKEAKKMARAIVEAGKKLVIFSAFANGWEFIAKELKRLDSSITIKSFSHGGNSLLAEEYDWAVFNLTLDLYNNKIIDELGFAKKSLYEFYKQKGYRCSFIGNTIDIEDKEKFIVKDKNANAKTKIGLYASGDRWVKNTYNQISAASLFENAELDCIPINYKISDIARRYGLTLNGKEVNVSREELYERMAQNDVNMYVTYTECSPLIPLESLELEVPCITGDNHHYFIGTELEKYLVVSKEDDIMAIYDQMKVAMENKDTIIKLYKEWKRGYNLEVQKDIESFLKV